MNLHVKRPRRHLKRLIAVANVVEKDCPIVIAAQQEDVANGRPTMVADIHQ